MILKGSQRANGADLATHLMNICDNERVEIAALHGVVADDLHGAFAEFEAIASGTKAREPLYSLSINPSAPLTRPQYEEAIAAIEDRLGLAGQPRATVFHVKDGREHCHVVWSRIDAGKMRAIHMAHDHRRLCDLSCELAHKFGLDLPPGLQAWEKKQRFKKEKLEPTLAENAQAKKTGITPKQRRTEITAAYNQSDSAEAFRAALAQKRYILAKGDRRGLVVVDRFGDVHSLTRYVKDHSAKAIRQKLSAIKAGDLPDVEQARALVRDLAQQEGQGAAEGAGDKAQEARRRIEEVRRQALARAQAARRLASAQHEQEILTRQASEKLALHAAQESEKRGFLFRVRSAVADLIERTPALRSVLGPIQKLTHLDPRERHALEKNALRRRHAREKLESVRRARSLAAAEKREQESLTEALARLARRQGEEQARLRQEFYGAAQDQKLWRARAYDEGDVTQEFNELSGAAGGDQDDGEDDARKPQWKKRTEGLQRKPGSRRGPRR